MKKFSFWFAYWAYTLTVCSFLKRLFFYEWSIMKVFFFLLIFGVLKTLIFKPKDENFKRRKLDFFIKLFTKFFKSIRLGILYFSIMFRKFCKYLYFKFFFSCNFVFNLFKSILSKFFIIWRPIFKKLSYFGFLRTYQNKWKK